MRRTIHRRSGSILALPRRDNRAAWPGLQSKPRSAYSRRCCVMPARPVGWCGFVAGGGVALLMKIPYSMYIAHGLAQALLGSCIGREYRGSLRRLVSPGGCRRTVPGPEELRAALRPPIGRRPRPRWPDRGGPAPDDTASPESPQERSCQHPSRLTILPALPRPRWVRRRRRSPISEACNPHVRSVRCSPFWRLPA